MPFGLTNSPATFQYLMEKVIGNLNLKSCLVYLDDIVIFSSSMEEHLGPLVREVLIILHEADLKLKPSKCHYHSNKLEFLALKWAVTNKFHDDLYGHRFVVVTDNNPLTYVLTTAKLDAVGHRWLAELSEL